MQAYGGFWALWTEYHKVTFDGKNRLILLNPGITEISVIEIYSSWKEWVRLYDNSKWLPAMRVVGGDQIQGDAYLGATYFVTNGWRIRPYEENHTLIIDGNLYTDPFGESPFVTAAGNVSVAIQSTFSALIYSTLAQQEEIEHTVFNQGVTIDTTLASTNYGTEYPLGTPFKPIGNLPDAILIAKARGFQKIYVIGNLIIDNGHNVSAMHIYGQGATLNVTKTLITMVSGCITSTAHFHDCRITGYQGGEGNFHNCIISGLSNAHCHYVSCGFVYASPFTIQHSNTISGTHITDLHNCYSDELVPIIDRNGTRLNQIYNSYTGRIKFINQNRSTESGTVWINLNGGTIELDSSCTQGAFYISGTGTVIDNSAGSVVNTDQLHTPETIANRVWQHSSGASVITGTDKLALLEKILRNKTVMDQTTGKMTVYNDDGVTPLLVADVFEDSSGTLPYRGQGADRRERLT